MNQGPASLDQKELEALATLWKRSTPGEWDSSIEGRDHWGGDSIIDIDGPGDQYLNLYVDTDETTPGLDRHFVHQRLQDYLASLHEFVGRLLAEVGQLPATVGPPLKRREEIRFSVLAHAMPAEEWAIERGDKLGKVVLTTAPLGRGAPTRISLTFDPETHDAMPDAEFLVAANRQWHRLLAVVHQWRSSGASKKPRPPRDWRTFRFSNDARQGVTLCLEPVASEIVVPPLATVEVKLNASSDPIEQIDFLPGRITVWAFEDTLSLVKHDGSLAQLYPPPDRKHLWERLQAKPFPKLAHEAGNFALFDTYCAGHMNNLAKGHPLHPMARDPGPDDETLTYMEQLRKRRDLNADEKELLEYYELLEEVQVAVSLAVVNAYPLDANAATGKT